MALFGFKFTQASLDGLRKIKPKALRRRVKSKIDALVDDPYPRGSRKIAGVERNGYPVYRIRCSDYRILYVVSADEIVILDIANRKEAYGRFRG